jgi:hypothetical protein
VCYFGETKTSEMIDNDLVRDYFEKTIVYLAKDTNRTQKVRRDDLFDLMGIPKDYRLYVWNKMWGSPRYVDGVISCKNPTIGINHKGVRLAQEILERIERDKPKRYARQCDDVLKFLLQSDNSRIAAQAISDAIKIDVYTVDAILEDLHENKLLQLADQDGHHVAYVLPLAERFAKKTSFLIQSEKQAVANISNSFNTSTTHGKNSPTALGQSSINQTVNESKKEEKKKWWRQIIDWIWEQVKKPVIAAMGSFIIGFISGRTTSGDGRLNNQQDSLTRFQLNKKTPEKDTSSNKITVPLDTIK